MPSDTGLTLLISDVEPNRRQCALAVAISALVIIFFAVTAPMASIQLPAVWVFLPLHVASYVTVSLITAVLLFGQFRLSRSRAILLLGGAYLFDGLMAVIHALSFPGLFASTGLLAAGPQTTAWLYFLWHGGFPLFIGAYALLKRSRHDGLPLQTSLPSAVLLVAVGTLALTGGLLALTTSGHDLLPVIMTNNLDAPNKMIVAVVTWLLSFAALAMLWRNSPRSLLDLWLMVVVLIWIFDSALAAVFNHARFDVGWYAGRICGLFAGSLVLVVLLFENTELYLRLAHLRDQETRRLGKKLHLSEQNFAAAFAQNPAALTLTRLEDGRYFEVNETWSQLTGFSRIEAIGRTSTELGIWSNPKDRKGFIDVLASKGEIRRHEVTLAKKSGEAFVAEVSSRMMEIDGNRFALSTLIDMTALKRSERRQKQRQEILHQVLSDAPLGRVFDLIVQSVEYIDEGSLCSILLLDKSGQHLLFGAAPSLPDFYNQAIDGMAIGDGRGSCGTAAFRGERVIVEDIQTHPYWADFKALAARAGVSSCWSEPIKDSRQQVLGTFAIYHHEPLAPTAEQIEFIREASALTALAIERRSREAELRQLSLAVNQSPESIVITNLRAEIEYVNPAFLLQTGYTREEVIGKNPRLLQSGRTPRETYDGLWYSLAQGIVWQGDLFNRRKDGSEFVEHAIISPIRQPDGTVINYLAIKEDITEKRRMSSELDQYHQQLELMVEQRTAELMSLTSELRESEARFRELSEAAPVLLWMAGPDKLCFHFNRHWLDFTGRSLEQEMGNGWAEGVHPDDRQRCMDSYTRSFDAHQPFSIEYRLRHHSGEYRWILDNGVPRFDRNQNFLGYIGGCTDIALIKRAEAEKETARQATEQLAQRKSEFLANMSHEIRTPLNGVLGLAQIGYRDNVGRRKAQEAFSRILDSGKLLLTIINDILDFSKIEAGKLLIEEIPLDPARLIEEKVQGVAHLASAKGIRLTTCHDNLPATVLGDAVRISQILYNLLSNAIKFTDDGEVCLSAAPIGDELHFAVRDTGIGIAPEALSRLFQPFEQADSSTTRKFGGTGLGLTISRRLAELMGGSLDVVSVPGQGSTFTLRIPCKATDEPILTRTIQNSVGNKRLNGMYVLVAEDNAVNQLVLDDMLRGEGAEVVMASNGQQALEMAEKAQHAFDAVLMDVQMPVMDGLTATRLLKSNAPNLPIIGQTAHALKEEHDKCLAAGMSATVNKPIDLEILVSTLLEYQGASNIDDDETPRPPLTPTHGEVLPVVDWEVLIHRYASRPDFVDHLVGLYLKDHADDGPLLRDLAACSDIRGIEHMAHDAKGTAGNIFATELQKQAVITLECARRNSAATVLEAEKLADAMDRVSEAFRQRRLH